MSNYYINEIKKTLSDLNPYKAILFGSYASGVPQEDSDVDLIVILNNESLPESFADRMKNYSLVRKSLKTINKQVALDLIVYTKAEWKKLLEINNSFYKEIQENGKQLI